MNVTSQVLLCGCANSSLFVSQLQEFVHFPSISTQPKHAADVRQCASWLANHSQQVSLERVKVVTMLRHPLVHAESRHAHGRPAVLIYGNYDAPPVEPLQEGIALPFEPMERGSYSYDRGASDDKGHHVKAVEAFLQTRRGLPVAEYALFL
jgi:acetylornithine deacetylase/succinyl-diaminopimelate desuccinylase-like protein